MRLLRGAAKCATLTNFICKHNELGEVDGTAAAQLIATGHLQSLDLSDNHIADQATTLPQLL